MKNQQLESFLKRVSKKIRIYLHVTKASGIARRYFIMNGFDGAMTVFGIVLGSWIARVSKPELILLAGFGACLAMGVSGFFGALMAEKAERERHLKEMEEVTKNRVDPLHYKAARFVVIYVALIEGLSPAITAAIPLSPFILASTKLITIFNAYVFSLMLSMTTLFLLGIYLGRIAKENGLLYGVAMLAVGALTAVIILVTQLLMA